MTSSASSSGFVSADRLMRFVAANALLDGGDRADSRQEYLRFKNSNCLVSSSRKLESANQIVVRRISRVLK